MPSDSSKSGSPLHIPKTDKSEEGRGIPLPFRAPPTQRGERREQNRGSAQKISELLLINCTSAFSNYSALDGSYTACAWG
jgi:hypothetical protein